MNPRRNRRPMNTNAPRPLGPQMQRLFLAFLAQNAVKAASARASGPLCNDPARSHLLAQDALKMADQAVSQVRIARGTRWGQSEEVIASVVLATMKRGR